MPPKGKRRADALVTRDAFELLRRVDGKTKTLTRRGYVRLSGYPDPAPMTYSVVREARCCVHKMRPTRKRRRRM
jgi:hypothetical protein